MFLNRKERKQIAKKIHINKGSKKAYQNWQQRKVERKQLREKETLDELNLTREENGMNIDGVPENVPFSSATDAVYTQKKPYSLHVALPGSILNNAQSPELRTYLAGQVARFCCIFCVDEIIIFDETARMRQSQIDNYYGGHWFGNEPVSEQNVECNFLMARILEYLECPQYLRKALFPLQKPLKFAGVLNPLDGMHHLRSTNLNIPYREGVILNKPIKQGHGSLVDVGLEKELELEESELPPKTRITVKITQTAKSLKRYRGTLISPRQIRKEAGIYWGYKVRLAKSLSDVLSKDYDVVIGTSERGTPLNSTELPIKKKSRILIVFGGLNGIESALEADESILTNYPTEYFPLYVNVLPDQGSRIIRTEEAIPIALSLIKAKLEG